ncbi:bifunctional oligoribonuclease/PAP phosphatase NrnA [Myxococcota bacterium]|nr:bifunctional oligoribonuclease/PAP phosphatase NrnA [Myxococcota bacterium]MBU1379487.1 bifunctional oligoribonuclease/PAP phosphatase NrnA [Myxococcota bacterium]MBU1497916.1 bifunctional oligoribonuclease/PAP phosphatase NrnA [Myxococcota bacterium]
MNDFSSCIPWLDKNILITGHRHPDGDAIGSVLALYNISKSLGGNPRIYSQDVYTEDFRFLEGYENLELTIGRHEKFDACFVVDSGSIEMLGKDFPDKDHRGVLIVIDHHSTRTPFGDNEVVDSTASACGILIQELAKAANCALTPSIASCLWLAVASDTGSFRYSSTDPRTMRYSGELLEAGADPWQTASVLYESNPTERMKLLGFSLRTLEVRLGGKAASMMLTNSMIAECGTDSEQASGFVNYPRSIRGVEIAFFVREDEVPGKVRVSFRSRGKFSVDNIASSLGGGGHPNAAGATFECSISCAVDHIYKIIRETYGW